LPRIVIIGAGSGFGGKLSKDILALSELRDSVIALCDIDAGRLSAVTRYVQRIIEHYDLPAHLESATDRRRLLRDADFVITSIAVGGPAYAGFPFNAEVNIPARYGVSQSVADTIGVGGVFRFLRTGPVQWDICRDMEELCPHALMLNYTNPMCMLTWLHSAGSSVANVGLCHSVQGTAHELEGYLGVPHGEMTYLTAGINHQAWYLRLRHHGEDLYPRLRALLDDSEVVAKDTVRFEMFRHFGYFVTESTRHCSEYHPYFRRTQELRDRFGLKERIVPDTPSVTHRTWLAEPETAEIPPLTPSHEYAAEIIRAMTADAPFRFNGNVMNAGLLSNLPEGCCVEVPCLVDAEGVHPCHVGALPPQLSALNQSNIAVQELAVRAVLDRDREAAFHACAMDPLTRSICSLDQIRALFEELWEAERPLLTNFENRGQSR
jgi:alpha-galactosidase